MLAGSAQRFDMAAARQYDAPGGGDTVWPAFDGGAGVELAGDQQRVPVVDGGLNFAPAASFEKSVDPRKENAGWALEQGSATLAVAQRNRLTLGITDVALDEEIGPVEAEAGKKRKGFPH